jgi:hypothetical protein
MLLREIASKNTLTFGNNSICLILLASSAISKLVIDTAIYKRFIKLTLSVYLIILKSQIRIQEKDILRDLLYYIQHEVTFEFFSTDSDNNMTILLEITESNLKVHR